MTTKRVTLRSVGYYLLAAGFFIYGAMRLGGSVPAIGQIMGWWDTELGRGVVEAIEPELPTLNAGSFVAYSLGGYIGWSATMGLLLTAGSLLALFRVRAGYALMALYFILFAAGFVNSLVFNVKLLHLAVGVGLFVLMIWLSDSGWPGRRGPGATARRT